MNRLQRGRHVTVIEDGVEFFSVLKRCEKFERLYISGYRSG